MTEAELETSFTLAWSNEGFVSREHEEARLEAGPGRAPPVPDRTAPAGRRDPDVRRAGVQLPARRRPGPRSLGPGGRRARCEERSDAGHDAPSPPAADQVADVVSPTLEMLGPERVTITDYKSSDVRDPVKARQRARDSLQLQIYAMGYEAMTGRLPDAVALHFLESGLVGRGGGRSEAPRQGTRQDRARPPPGCARGTTRRRRTTSPARTARSATSARRASRADRAFDRVDGGGARPPSSGSAPQCTAMTDRRLHRPCHRPAWHAGDRTRDPERPGRGARVPCRPRTR